MDRLLTADAGCTPVISAEAQRSGEISYYSLINNERCLHSGRHDNEGMPEQNLAVFGVLLDTRCCSLPKNNGGLAVTAGLDTTASLWLSYNACPG
jgi:hypothetical protein